MAPHISLCTRLRWVYSKGTGFEFLPTYRIFQLRSLWFSSVPKFKSYLQYYEAIQLIPEAFQVFWTDRKLFQRHLKCSEQMQNDSRGISYVLNRCKMTPEAFQMFWTDAKWLQRHFKYCEDIKWFQRHFKCCEQIQNYSTNVLNRHKIIPEAFKVFWTDRKLFQRHFRCSEQMQNDSRGIWNVLNRCKMTPEAFQMFWTDEKWLQRHFKCFEQMQNDSRGISNIVKT
jgi:hypothetical protein